MSYTTVAISPQMAQKMSRDLRMLREGNSKIASKFMSEARDKQEKLNACYQYQVVGKGDNLVAQRVMDLPGTPKKKQTSGLPRVGTVAIIPIVGAMTKYSSYHWWWGYTRGTSEVIADIQRANMDEDIDSILIYADSPGGDVDGTHLLYEAIRTSGKPVVTMVSGVCASACIWACSASSKIYATSPQDMIGSIGVYVLHEDMSAMLDLVGLKYTFIVSEGSTDKVVAPSTEPLSDADRQKVERMITVTKNEFVTAVKAGRPNLNNETAFTGEVFGAKEAQKLGLIDGIKSMTDIIVDAAKDGRRNKRSSSQAKSSSMSLFAKFGIGSQKVATEPVELPAEEVNQLYAKLEEGQKAGSELSTVKAEAESLKSEATANTQKVMDLEAQVADLTAKLQAAEAKEPEATDNTELKAEIESLKAQINGVEANQEAKVEAVEGLLAKAERVDAMSAELEALRAEKAELEAFKASTTEAYDKLVASYNTLATTAGKAPVTGLGTASKDKKTLSMATAFAMIPG